MTERISLQDALSAIVPSKGDRSGPGTCFYCGRHATRIEWDHFPIAHEFGGDTVVPACITCHDLKDRRSIEEWPAEMIREAFEGLTPMAALLLSKAVQATMRAESSMAERPRRDRSHRAEASQPLQPQEA